jgi:hypothetical protein
LSCTIILTSPLLSAIFGFFPQSSH